MRELKECPFCGVVPKAVVSEKENKLVGIVCGNTSCDKSGLIICYLKEKEETAINQWNKASACKFDRLAEGLRSAIKELERVDNVKDGQPLVSHNLMLNLRQLLEGV